MNNNFLPFQIKKTNENFNDLSSQLAQKAKKIRINLSDYGAVGDGIVDDTTKIQNALNAIGTLAKGGYLEAETNKVYKVTSSLAIPSNIVVDFCNSELRLEVTSIPTNDCLLLIKQIQNVEIKNVKLFGSRLSMSGSHETMPNVNIVNSQNVSIHDIYSTNAKGDNILVDSQTALGTITSNIRIYNNTLIDPFRNQVSVVGGSDIEIYSNYLYTALTAYQWSGVDIEPSTLNQPCYDIRFHDNTVIGSQHAAIASDGSMKATSYVYNIKFYNNLFKEQTKSQCITQKVIDVEVYNNTFLYETNTSQAAITGVKIDESCSRITVKNNTFNYYNTTGTSIPVYFTKETNAVTKTNIRIENNTMFGNQSNSKPLGFNQYGIKFDCGFVDIFINKNYFHNFYNAVLINDTNDNTAQSDLVIDQNTFVSIPYTISNTNAGIVRLTIKDNTFKVNTGEFTETAGVFITPLTKAINTVNVIANTFINYKYPVYFNNVGGDTTSNFTAIKNTLISCTRLVITLFSGGADFQSLANKAYFINNAAFPQVNTTSFTDDSKNVVIIGETDDYGTSSKSVSSLPSASSAYRGKSIAVAGGTGVADKTYICMKTASDTYSWVQVSTG